MSAAGRMLERRHAGGGWARGVRPLLAALLLVVGAQRASAQTEVVEYYGQDALGSIRIVFDASGAAVARADYEPFGELFTVPTMPGTSELPAKQFTGQERDAEASLDYFGARFFVPRTGRFSQVDPVYAGLLDPQQWNRYAYARNNPLTFIDPTGMQASTGIPGYCSAFNSYERCGGDDLFWGSGGGGGFSFGDSYAGALDRGFVPGMAADIWAGLEEMNTIADQAAAYALERIQRAEAEYQAHYRDRVDQTLAILGLIGIVTNAEWTGSGYSLKPDDAESAKQAVAGRSDFASGPFGVLHANDVGWKFQDFRSFTSSAVTRSLQLTVGQFGGWVDVDKGNPYQDLWSFVIHTLEVVHIIRP